MHSQKAAVDKGESSTTTFFDNGYNPQLASGGRDEATVGSGSKNARETVGNNGGCNGSSVHARAGERLPLVQQRLRSASETRELEGGDSRSVNDGAGGYARSPGGGNGEGKGVDAGGGESRGGGESMAFWRGFLLPMKLLEEKRVRHVMFLYALVSVRGSCSDLLHTILGVR